MLTIGSLFSGIGGLELGLEMAGLGPVVWQAETNPFCRRVLMRHWPSARRFHDVRQVKRSRAQRVDLICGGFPCQDISSAGKGAGLAGDRSGLWFQFARVLKEMRPSWAVVENVASGARRWVDQVTAELAGLGFQTLPIPLSAADVGAPHLRRRVFLVAYSERQSLRDEQGGRGGSRREGATESRHHGQAGRAPDPGGQRLALGQGDRHDLRQGRPSASRARGAGNAPDADGDRQPALPVNEQMGWLSAPTEDGGREWRPPVPPVCGVDDGISSGVVRASGNIIDRWTRTDQLKALGNAVVPQCAEVVGWVVRELLSENTGPYRPEN